jgi:trehalose-phosphatase
MPPKYLFDEWPRLVRELREHEAACILLDFDGTLSPFAKRPELASIPPKTKHILKALSLDPRYRVGVISGRSLKDIRMMVSIQGIFYAGNHGLEVEGPGISFVHPEAEKYAAAITEFTASLELLLRNFKGAIVEDKGLTASVHYRLAEEKDVELMLQIIDTEARKRRGLTLCRGKKVVEIKPDVAWGKGSASELILSRIGGDCLPVYVGDDETDEEAFRSSMITWPVRVMEKEVPTKARYFLRNVAEVDSLLKRLATLGTKAKASSFG